MGDIIETKDFEISVLSVSKTKIETIKLIKKALSERED